MKVSRRSLLQGIAASGVIAATPSVAGTAPDSTETSTVGGLALMPPATVSDPLLNHASAVDTMAAEGVDLLLCSDPVNVFYLTNQRIVSNMLGMDMQAFAAFSATGKSKPALITGEFGYYLSSDDKAIPGNVDLKLFSSPAEPALYAALDNAKAIATAAAAPGYITPTFSDAPARPFETSRRAEISGHYAEMSASSEAALIRTLLETDLPNRTVAVDDLKIVELLKRSGLDLHFVDGERLLRRIRLRKSPAEIVYARYAALANAEAGLAAARTVEAGASFRDLRTAFATGCGERMTSPVYMLIDGVISPLTDEKIERGRSFLIDCVSTFEGYHGDYGRTVCVGEPTRKMQQIIDALSFVWDRVLPELKVGVAYSDIWALGQKLFAETKIDAGLVMGPHAVGLHHTDEPGARDFSPFEKQNLTLEEDMVISVDMPVLGSGLGGTAHLEDLVLIGKDGPELLNASSDRFIVV